jgi:hypothetical protein
MQGVTSLTAAQFQTGQSMEQQFQMTSGRCYAALTQGQGVDIKIQFILLQPVPGIPNPVLAEGTGGKLGTRGQCFKWALPFGVNVKATYTAVSGSGIAAGRVYAK